MFIRTQKGVDVLFLKKQYDWILPFRIYIYKLWRHQHFLCRNWVFFACGRQQSLSDRKPINHFSTAPPDFIKTWLLKGLTWQWYLWRVTYGTCVTIVTPITCVTHWHNVILWKTKIENAQKNRLELNRWNTVTKCDTVTPLWIRMSSNLLDHQMTAKVM
jgi:hypothetical protein